jgi:uncharacterized membrane protein YgcG
LHHGLAAVALSLALTLSPVRAPAAASEFDVLNDGPPADTYVVDDAGVLSRVTKSDVKRLARDLEARKNIRINFVTVRKLTVRVYCVRSPCCSELLIVAKDWVRRVRAEQS